MSHDASSRSSWRFILGSIQRICNLNWLMPWLFTYVTSMDTADYEGLTVTYVLSFRTSTPQRVGEDLDIHPWHLGIPLGCQWLCWWWFARGRNGTKSPYTWKILKATHGYPWIFPRFVQKIGVFTTSIYIQKTIPPRPFQWCRVDSVRWNSGTKGTSVKCLMASLKFLASDSSSGWIYITFSRRGEKVWSLETWMLFCHFTVMAQIQHVCWNLMSITNPTLEKVNHRSFTA